MKEDIFPTGVSLLFPNGLHGQHDVARLPGEVVGLVAPSYHVEVAVDEAFGHFF